MQDADEFVAEYYSRILQLSHFAIVKKSSLAHAVSSDPFGIFVRHGVFIQLQFSIKG